jgi:hypothetical protein
MHSEELSMTMRLALAVSAVCLSPALAAAQATTVNYTMSFAGLPIGSATMSMTPNGGSTAVAFSGHAGGPLQIGRMSATANIGQGRVTAQSNAGSGKDASTSSISSQGAGGSSSFNFSGVNGRGPGKLAMTVAGGRVTALEASIPDNPEAKRTPVTDAHKTGVLDPLMALAQVIRPGGTFRPEGVCGASLQVFTGIARISLVGSAPEETKGLRGLPDGYRAVACRVAFTPVAGHRIDKGRKAEARTASVVFAATGDKVVLWSVSVPASVGSFALTAREIR